MSNLKEPYNRKDITVGEIIERYSGKNNGIEDAEKWSGFKEFTLVDKIKECEDIVSFYFKPTDDKKLVKHIPGQYLPLRIKSDDEKYKEVLRTYSLSMIPNENLYRISVKRIEGGLISSYLHDEMKVGSKIEAMIPAGLFTLEDKDNNPIVLMAGGIGITPLLSMLYSKFNSKSQLYFIQAVQNSQLQPFKNDIEIITKESNFKNIIFFDKPLESDVLGKDYNYKGFITKEWIEENLPLNAEFYFCGPPPFMRGINRSLLSLGVSKENIHYEFFGEPQALE